MGKKKKDMTEAEIRAEDIGVLMCYILRHNPYQFGLELYKGFCETEDFVDAIKTGSKFSDITMEEVEEIVRTCSKQRYTIDGSKIKANYGHSIPMEYQVAKPTTKILYHGTNTKVIDTILKEGLKKMNRLVHMSEGTEFATLSGKRRGELVMIEIDAQTAYNDGIEFFFAGGDVWLANFIPAKYLKRVEVE